MYILYMYVYTIHIKRIHTNMAIISTKDYLYYTFRNFDNGI